MSRDSQERFDVLVVGGGPAGMAAAVCASECGASVGIVDDNVAVGGQIWRGKPADTRSKQSAEWRERLQSSGAKILCGKRILHQPEADVLLAEGDDDLFEIRYKNLILATGARERFLPFPGWTLPNVLGAGGLQAMVKSGLPIRGKRVVVAGTGPLLLAVAVYLHQHGAEIPIVCEQASWKSLARFSVALLPQPAKILEGLHLKRELAAAPFATSSWVRAAHGKNALESITVSRDGKLTTIPCDYLACGFHLVPNIELPVLIGCGVHRGFVQVNEFQQTTVPKVFCAGEPTRIGGVESALVEGQIAGFASAGNHDRAKELFSRRDRTRKFSAAMQRAFCLRPELRTLASPETIVCRCEDVTYSRLQQQTSWRSAKLYTRCGMGPCQGRICGPATQFLFKWNPESVRPPVFPARVENLAAFASRPDPEHSAVTGGL